MRTFGFLLLVGFVAVCATPGAADEAAKPQAKEKAAADAGPTVVTLREAAQAGDIEVEGYRANGYQHVHLRIRNLRKELMRVDLCGSHMEPRTGGRCQRLGIGPIVTPRKRRVRPPDPSRPPGTVVMELAPGQDVTVEVNTCCLDAGKPAPTSRHTFRVARSKLPAVREKVLRWWADNPDTPQYAVNTAIWKFRGEVHVPEDAPSANPKYTGVAAHAGILYRLREGELMSLDADGIERFLGTEILDVYPTDSAIYAEALGPPRGQERVRARELWRLVPTGEDPWALVAHIPAGLSLHDLQVAPSGAVLITASKGLYRLSVPTKQLVLLMATEDIDNLSVGFAKGKILATLRTPRKEGYYQGGELKNQGMGSCQLWALDPKTGGKKLVKEFWNVRQVKTGQAGTYALTPAGKLRRLVGRSFKNAPGQNAYTRILHVGRTCVWLESKKGRLVAVGKGGNLRFASGPDLDWLIAWTVDRHSDDVLLLRRGRDYYRLDSKRGREERVPPR